MIKKNNSRIKTEDVKKVILKNPGKTKKELAEIMQIGIKRFVYHYNKLLLNKEIDLIDDKTGITERDIENLEYYFTHGFTDAEACLQVWVAERTFYQYCSKNPEWANRRQVLKRKQVMTAKLEVSKALLEGKDDFVKMVYQEDKRRERSEVKVDLGVDKNEGEDFGTVSLKVSISD